jgi:hypothetical protein
MAIGDWGGVPFWPYETFIEHSVSTACWKQTHLSLGIRVEFVPLYFDVSSSPLTTFVI